MVNLLTAVTSILQLLLKLFGLRPLIVEIDPGTVIHLWAPSQFAKFNQAKYVKGKQETHKPALLLLHGFGASGVLTWLFQIITFSKNYSVFVPDLLFFGGSTTDKADRSPAFQARCLARAMRALGVERCAVVGCSYGGIVGARMASAEAGLVGCLVLSNSNLALTESLSSEAFERVGIRAWPELLLPETVQGLKKLLRAVIYKRPWFPDWAYKHFLEIMFDGREERAELLKALVIKDSEFIIPNFSHELKIYIIAGEEDQLFNIENVKKTREKLGDRATLHSIEKAGHLVHIERPFVYNRLLKKILQTSL